MKSNRCPNCGCPRIKNGKRRLKLIGTVQNYLCRNCGCQARDSDFTGYMYPRKIIDAAVSLYQSGITLEYVKINIERIFGITIKSLSAIWNWVQIFRFKFEFTFLEMFHILHGDETKAKTYKKGKYFWFWALKCPFTKLIVAWHVSETRELGEAKDFFKKAKKRFPIGTAFWPKKIRTDSMPSYYRAIMETFSREVKHNKFRSFEEHSNNDVGLRPTHGKALLFQWIENFFRFKRRFPRFHTPESAKNYFDSWVAQHNERIAKNLKGKAAKMIQVKIFAKFWNMFATMVSYGF